MNALYATAFKKLLWPGGVVYYRNFNITHEGLLEKIRQAMKEIESNTCIRFVKKSKNQKDYLNLISHNGCWSFVGKQGGSQDLSLNAAGCYHKNIVAHELMHAIGFHHKHSQHDRDEYLQIYWGRVLSWAIPAFKKIPASHTRTFADFDYMSIMLYGPRLFSINGLDTMRRRDGGYLIDIENKPGLSSKDIYSINQLYKCKGRV